MTARMRTLLRLGFLILLALAAFIVIQTSGLTSLQITVEPAPAPERGVDAAGAAQRLAGALRFPTISHLDPAQFDGEAFLALHSYLQGVFPEVFSGRLEREVVSDHSLLLRWLGQDASLKPALLMAHLDVVPVEPGSVAAWEYPPFGGQVAEGYVWGRGAMDDKASLMAILEAAEALLAAGFEPRRTIYFAFGHDEEAGGRQGAAQIADLLRKGGVALEMVLDEGLAVVDGVLPGIPQPVALIGIAEKGFLTLELRVETAGGHSSMPPPQTAIGILSAAIQRLEQHPMPASLEGPAGRLFRYLGPEMPLAQRVAVANRWLFGPLLERRLAASPATNALMRTTTAVTLIQGGVKENVLPLEAHAAVNFRIRPGDTVASVTEHVWRTIDDRRVDIRPAEGLAVEPSAVSPIDSAAFELLRQTIHEVFADAISAPSLVLGATDSRHYAGLTRNIYRFMPLRVGPADISRIHSTNERISVENYGQAVRFYSRFLRKLGAGS